MGTERFWKIHWAVAVWHNVIGGVGLLFLGDWVYQREGLQPPVPGVNYVRWMLLILVFAYVYFMVYKDLYNTEKLVRAGILASWHRPHRTCITCCSKPASPKSFGSPSARITSSRSLSFCSYDGCAGRKT